ncbi:hypothetical protein K402DRAFT_408338 [Aulographum hederae CBS 113979]|uniref:Uncharacterized protein n=1 Tax=Aulographum hederae CBS 113979 TaxID=1176131 RepID=A0A6G1GLB3_9PEZI|nr:hypothetical protein K402DRAFT_408338 [Aulographum hederae CBS 113979]
MDRINEDLRQVLSKSWKCDPSEAIPPCLLPRPPNSNGKNQPDYKHWTADYTKALIKLVSATPGRQLRALHSIAIAALRGDQLKKEAESNKGLFVSGTYSTQQDFAGALVAFNRLAIPNPGRQIQRQVHLSHRLHNVVDIEYYWKRGVELCVPGALVPPGPGVNWNRGLLQKLALLAEQTAEEAESAELQLVEAAQQLGVEVLNADVVTRVLAGAVPASGPPGQDPAAQPLHEPSRSASHERLHPVEDQSSSPWFVPNDRAESPSAQTHPTGHEAARESDGPSAVTSGTLPSLEERFESTERGRGRKRRRRPRATGLKRSRDTSRNTEDQRLVEESDHETSEIAPGTDASLRGPQPLAQLAGFLLENSDDDEPLSRTTSILKPKNQGAEEKISELEDKVDGLETEIVVLKRKLARKDAIIATQEKPIGRAGGKAG